MSSILLLCALPEEKNALLAEFEGEPEKIVISDIFNLTALKFNLGKHQVFIKETGMGNVNAGIGLALFLEKISINQVILIGVGGALTPDLKIGDLVLSSTVLQHDYISSLDFGDYRMYPGALILDKEDSDHHDPLIKSSKSYLELSIENDPTVFNGIILSGSEFVGTTKRKKDLSALHPKAMLVDMEASAIGVVAERAGVPFLIAKTVSDRLLPDGSIENDFTLFLKQASQNAARITVSLLKSLGR